VDEAETTPEIAWRGPVSEARERVPEMRELVVVALVVVALIPVKFCRVDEPVTRRFESVESPPVAVKVVPTASEPVKLAVEEMVCPLMRPDVMRPRVELPAFRVVAKRLVEDAVVEKRLVVVAFVVVEFPLMVRFPTVEEAVRRIPLVVVGARYPVPCTDQSRNRESQYSSEEVAQS
jgi:hypothetical protein